jgi:hypothetical protein
MSRALFSRRKSKHGEAGPKLGRFLRPFRAHTYHRVTESIFDWLLLPHPAHKLEHQIFRGIVFHVPEAHDHVGSTSVIPRTSQAKCSAFEILAKTRLTGAHHDEGLPFRLHPLDVLSIQVTIGKREKTSVHGVSSIRGTVRGDVDKRRGPFESEDDTRSVGNLTDKRKRPADFGDALCFFGGSLQVIAAILRIPRQIRSDHQARPGQGILFVPAYAGFTCPAVRRSAAISPADSALTTDSSPLLAEAAARCFVVASMALAGAGMATLK